MRVGERTKAILLASAAAAAFGLAEQGAVAQTADTEAAHVAAADRAAGQDLRAPFRLCPGAPQPAAPASHTAEPAKVFDNLYFVGIPAVSAWAITTSNGIIVIDSLNNAGEAETFIEGGLRKVGLDPAQVKYVFASSGVGTTIHMSGELFKAMAGIDILHVPYRGLAAGGYADLMTGMVHVAFDNLPPSIELIRAGKLRALAVTSATRSQAMPDLPTVADFLPGYEASAWYGIAAPAGTPAALVERLNQELNAAFVDPKMKALIADLGGTPLPGSPADFAKLFAEETEKWAKVVKFSGAKQD